MPQKFCHSKRRKKSQPHHLVAIGVAALLACALPGCVGSVSVPTGQAAPRFSLPSSYGPTISLDGALQGKKAVLVNFWFYS